MQHISITPQERNFHIDLTPFMNPAAYTVTDVSPKLCINIVKNAQSIPTEKRNCEILKLLQKYKNDKKSKFILTYMLFKIFLRQIHKMVRKESRILCI